MVDKIIKHVIQICCKKLSTNQLNILCESSHAINNMTIEEPVQYDEYLTYYIILHCSKMYIYCTYA